MTLSCSCPIPVVLAAPGTVVLMATCVAHVGEHLMYTQPGSASDMPFHRVDGRMDIAWGGSRLARHDGSCLSGTDGLLEVVCALY